jgi:hypothetical protein
MPAHIVHVGAVANCPHGGPVTFAPVAPRVFVSGAPVPTMADQAAVAACAFNISGSPHPCLRIQWQLAALRVTSNLSPLILRTSAGLCVAADQAPQGPPIIGASQPRAMGT